MRFIKYLNESRARKLDEDMLRYYLKNDFRDMTKNYLKGNVIFRGMRTNLKYSLLDPSKFSSRKSANTQDYYTLFINNHPKWKKYPKREVICTSSEMHARGYGDIHIILPKNGAKIGVCPSSDIWSSFYKTLNTYPTLSLLDDFNNELRNLGISDDSYEEMKIDAIGKDDVWGVMEDMWDVMEDVLDPDKNKFEVVSTKNYTKPNKPREIWTDDMCLVIDENVRNDFYKIAAELYGG